MRNEYQTGLWWFDYLPRFLRCFVLHRLGIYSPSLVVMSGQRSCPLCRKVYGPAIWKDIWP